MVSDLALLPSPSAPTATRTRVTAQPASPVSSFQRVPESCVYSLCERRCTPPQSGPADRSSAGPFVACYITYPLCPPKPPWPAKICGWVPGDDPSHPDGCPNDAIG